MPMFMTARSRRANTSQPPRIARPRLPIIIPANAGRRGRRRSNTAIRATNSRPKGPRTNIFAPRRISSIPRPITIPVPDAGRTIRPELSNMGIAFLMFMTARSRRANTSRPPRIARRRLPIIIPANAARRGQRRSNTATPSATTSRSKASGMNIFAPKRIPSIRRPITIPASDAARPGPRHSNTGPRFQARTI